MSVEELIEELQKIENKDLDVVIINEYGEYTTDYDVIKNVERYFGAYDDDGTYSFQTRECVLIAF